MIKKEFEKYLISGIGKIIKISGPIRSTDPRFLKDDRESRLGLLLDVYCSDARISKQSALDRVWPDSTGSTQINAGNSVMLARVLIGTDDRILWLSAKFVELL
jgi:hypothetical protein